MSWMPPHTLLSRLMMRASIVLITIAALFIYALTLFRVLLKSVSRIVFRMRFKVCWYVTLPGMRLFRTLRSKLRSS